LGKSKLIFAALVLATVIGGYFFYIHNPKSKQDKYTSAPPHIDTSMLSKRPSITTSNDTAPSPPPVGEQLAPGTAWAEARILSVEYSDSLPSKISVHIKRVRGYGPSTPPIAPDSKLSINVLRFVKANMQYKGTFEKNAEISTVLTYRKGISMGGRDSGGSWAIVDIK